MFFQTTIVVTREKENLDIKKILDILNSDLNPTLELAIKRDPKKNSIGIEELKPLIEWNALKSEKLRMGIVFSAESITTEGQNSLLKVLEEPSQNTLIILVASNLDNLLKTIISRSKIIYDRAVVFESKYRFEHFQTLSLAEKYKLMEEITSLEDPYEVLHELVEDSLNFITKNHETFDKFESANMVRLLEELIRAIKLKISIKLIVENFISNISLIK